MANILEIAHLTKRYPGVVALNDVTLSVEEGKIHALMGENGAGKSTLIKAIAGAIRPEAGTITINGTSYKGLTPSEARKAGIGVIYQEFNLVPSLSVAENIFLGENVGKNPFLPDFEEMERRSAEILADLGVNINVKHMVSDLSTAQQQLVEIAKAMVQNCKLLIMDEPSASIPVAEVENMFRIVRQLKERGVTILYISHRLDEIFELCDQISILRDGQYITTQEVKDVTRADLIRYMVGRELTETHPVRHANIGETVLEVKDLSGNGDFHIDLKVRKGEILGLAGLVGAGRTELAKMICGDVAPTGGEILVRGKPEKFSSVSDAVKVGIALIPEDRKIEGLFMDYSIGWNVPSMSFKRLSKLGVVNVKEQEALTDHYVDVLKIKTPSTEQKARNLSGGNQQKVVVARALAAQADVLIFDEPTRGIDVGAKQEIYKIMNELAEEGKAIIMISSDMEEILGMADRIAVLYEGRKTGELTKAEFSQSRVLELASGYVQ